MKKLLLFLLLSINLFAQTAENSWSIGFGGTYPRFMSSDVRPLETNYGGFLSIQRNFTLNVGLRLLGFYHSIEGRIPGGIYTYPDGTIVPSETENMRSNLIGASLDFLYYVSPCHSVSPYLLFGLGVTNFDADWGDVINSQAVSKTTAKLVLGLGSEWRLSDKWKLLTEFGFHSIDGQVDGIVNNSRQGVLGSDADSYITFDLGFNYYFSKGSPSKYCQLYKGISADVSNLENLATRDDIEEIVQKYIPKEVVKEVVVEKVVTVGTDGRWVLVGVNFDFNSTKLKPEAYPVLFHAVQVLLMNQDMNVEIRGYTDNVGSEKANKTLSDKRANVVKNYLVARGVSSSRLRAVGYGESNPITDNKTADGRAMNRRIEFKVLN